MDTKTATPRDTPRHAETEERTEELKVCTKAFNAETSRLEDDDDPCRTAEN